MRSIILLVAVSLMQAGCSKPSNKYPGMTNHASIAYDRHIREMKIGIAFSIMDFPKRYEQLCGLWYPGKKPHYNKLSKKWYADNKHHMLAAKKILRSINSEYKKERIKPLNISKIKSDISNSMVPKKKFLGYSHIEKMKFCKRGLKYMVQKEMRLDYIIESLNGERELSFEKQQAKPEKIKLRIIITAIDNNWKVSYLDGQAKGIIFRTWSKQIKLNNKYKTIIKNPIVLPKDTSILLQITSQQGIHSFYVPKLGLKRDAIQGVLNPIGLKASKTGIFQGACAEMGAFNVPKMRFEIRVYNKKNYLKWVSNHRRSVR